MPKTTEKTYVYVVTHEVAMEGEDVLGVAASPLGGKRIAARDAVRRAQFTGKDLDRDAIRWTWGPQTRQWVCPDPWTRGEWYYVTKVELEA